MSGSKTTMSKDQVLKALEADKGENDYVWDGVDEDDRPLTRKEMEASIKRGRPFSDNPKQPVSIRLSPAVIEHFKAGGKGWQTRINSVLEDYIARR